MAQLRDIIRWQEYCRNNRWLSLQKALRLRRTYRDIFPAPLEVYLQFDHLMASIVWWRKAEQRCRQKGGRWEVSCMTLRTIEYSSRMLAYWEYMWAKDRELEVMETELMLRDAQNEG